MRILIIPSTFTIQAKPAAERVQTVTGLNLKCDKMEFGHSNQAKTLSAEFDADLTAFLGISTVVVDTIHRESTKVVCLLTLKSMVTKKSYSYLF